MKYIIKFMSLFLLVIIIITVYSTIFGIGDYLIEKKILVICEYKWLTYLYYLGLFLISDILVFILISKYHEKYKS